MPINYIGYTYKTTCVPTGQVYIGQSVIMDQDKMKSYLGSGRLLRDAIRLHGYNNFKKEIIDFSIDQNELDESESYWVEFYQARNRLSIKMTFP